MADDPSGGVERDQPRDLWPARSVAESRRLRPNRWTIADVEARISRERIEWPYVFDLIGGQRLRKRGTADGVFLAADELHLIKNAIVVHNHPPYRHFSADDPRYDGGSFSERDLDLVASYDVAEMRAITGRWRHVVTRPPGGWSIDADSLVAVYQESIAEVDADIDAAAALDPRARPMAEARRVHETVARVAAWAGFDFRREER